MTFDPRPKREAQPAKRHITIDLSPADYDSIAAVAKMRGLSIRELARSCVSYAMSSLRPVPRFIAEPSPSSRYLAEQTDRIWRVRDTIADTNGHHVVCETAFDTADGQVAKRIAQALNAQEGGL
jgi:hypothetical protein